uniref:Uncharacterized protein LOC104232192 n=1 Tax=Nicotiana sylvestris TaxID=4096 RepID=A0A1U7XAZ5_NICSY|nr:PREDICTED: uncharacterized protein LOC104232192 [Nicotiana sylvestris]
MNLVEEVWSSNIRGNALWKLQQKLKKLSKRLTQWSKEEIGNVHEQVKLWESKMNDLEELDLQYNFNSSREELNKGQAKYIKWMTMQDSILKQKANIKWFEEGDSNNKYFHSLIREKRRRLQLHKIKYHRDRWVEGDDNIAKATIRHFHKRFNITHQFKDILDCIPRIITDDDNTLLTAMPNMEEIRYAVFDMGANSAASPDGFNDTFFQKCWDIIKDDITNFVQEIFNGKRLTKFFSQTCLVLIPKVKSPNSFSELRPISLSNFTAKIIFKILARRLNPILHKIISENQNRFVKGRSITENILLAQEITQNIKNKNCGGNVIIKLDMEKAYDRMS